MRPVRREEAPGIEPGELELVRRAKAGDAEAFGRLYDACIDRIHRYIFFRVTDQEVAEDLTSEVFLKAWQSLHRYRPGRPFVAWLYTIARNTVIDHYRTRKTSLGLEDVILRVDPGLDEGMDLQAELGAVRAAMQGLTEEQQHVLTLRFIEELETDRIAEVMGKSEGAIRALQMRALQALARQLKPDGRQQE